MAPEMETVVHCLESFREIMTNNSLEEFYFFSPYVLKCVILAFIC